MIWQDLLAALGLLTRLPIAVDTDHAMARGARSAWAYPLVGLIVAICVLICAALLDWLDVDPRAIAGVCLFASIMITGAMHEDGLADTADGLWGGWTPERRLEIMKDSRIGTYGVLALGLSLLIRYAAFLALIEAGMLWPGVVIASVSSRAVMLALMALLSNARTDGLSQSVGKPGLPQLWIGLGIAAGVTLCVWPWALPAIAIVSGISGVACAAIANRKIGGQTGDILGATQQISEIAVLCTLGALLG